MTNFKKPKIHKTRIVAQSNLFKIESIDIEFSNGVKRIYERIKPSCYETVMIIPIINEHLLLVREYNIGIENYELGFPKGLINNKETAIKAANRELMEEIGFGSHKFIFLNQLTIAPSYFVSKINIFIAQELYPYRLQGDEPEDLTLVRWPISHMLELLDESDFCESRSINALFLAYVWLNKIYKNSKLEKITK